MFPSCLCLENNHCQAPEDESERKACALLILTCGLSCGVWQMLSCSSVGCCCCCCGKSEHKRPSSAALSGVLLCLLCSHSPPTSSACCKHTSTMWIWFTAHYLHISHNYTHFVYTCSQFKGSFSATDSCCWKWKHFLLLIFVVIEIVGVLFLYY